SRAMRSRSAWRASRSSSAPRVARSRWAVRRESSASPRARRYRPTATASPRGSASRTTTPAGATSVGACVAADGASSVRPRDESGVGPRRSRHAHAAEAATTATTPAAAWRRVPRRSTAGRASSPATAPTGSSTPVSPAPTATAAGWRSRHQRATDTASAAATARGTHASYRVSRSVRPDSARASSVPAQASAARNAVTDTAALRTTHATRRTTVSPTSDLPVMPGPYDAAPTPGIRRPGAEQRDTTLRSASRSRPIGRCAGGPLRGCLADDRKTRRPEEVTMSQQPTGQVPWQGQPPAQEWTGQPPAPPLPQQPRRRSWFARHNVLTGLLVLVGVVVAVNLGGGDPDDPAPVTPPTTAQEGNPPP